MLEESNLFVQLTEARLEDALDALSELKYIAKCTERMFRVSHKYVQRTSIRSGIRKMYNWLKKSNEPVMETYLAKLKVTVSTSSQ